MAGVQACQNLPKEMGWLPPHSTTHGWLRAAGSILLDDSLARMVPVSHQAVAALSETLRGHVDLGKSRLETLCMLVVGMIGARTVNLGHIATEGSRHRTGRKLR